MTKSKNTKRTLLISVLSMMICCAMLIGSTFAWFTDSATSSNNNIVAGNLDIELLVKDKDGNYVEPSNGSLFDENMKWEPGQVYYRELKIENCGTLAAKFNVSISDEDFEANFVVEPTGYDEDGNPTTYTGTPWSLMDVIQFAAYGGTFQDLVDAVNDEVGPSVYELNDREVVMKALELGLIESDVLANTDPNYGSVYGRYISDDPDEFADDPDIGILPPGEEVEFTLITFWLPTEAPVLNDDAESPSENDGENDGDDGDEFPLQAPDNTYNLNNGKRASLSTDDGEVFDWENMIGFSFSEDETIDYLYIKFSLVVYAAQTPYESDSFGDDYDKDTVYVTPEPEVPDPIPGT